MPWLKKFKTIKPAQGFYRNQSKIVLIVTLKVPNHVTSGRHAVEAVFHILMCDMSLELRLLDRQDLKK